MNEMNNLRNNNENYPTNKKTKKINKILVIVIVILFGFITFIIFDKVIKKAEKTEPKKTEIKQLIKFDLNQLGEVKSAIKDGTEYRILSYINSDLKIDFSFYAKLQNMDDDTRLGEMYLEMFINGNKVDFLYDLGVFYIASNPIEKLTYNSLNEAFINAIISLKEHMGTIKGDKYYLYLSNIDDKIIFINEAGNILDNKNNNTKYLIRSDNYINLNNDCKLVKYAEDNKFLYKFTDDALYYVILDDNVNEYKLSIRNNQINVEKLGTCKKA